MTKTIAELTEAMEAFVQSKDWYDPLSPRPQTLRNLAISLSLEASEVLEHFQWRDKTAETLGNIERNGLASELADVALYLLQLARLSGIDLEQAILDKLKINYDRTWDK
jgi:NTP pyrophosphatase (non-canonical NTP hydrolase)